MRKLILLLFIVIMFSPGMAWAGGQYNFPGDSVLHVEEVGSDLIPETDNTQVLGSSSKRWAEGHVTLFLADNASVSALDVTGVTDNNIFYMSASGAADSPLDRVDATTLSVTGTDPAFTLIPSTAGDTRFWFGNINDANGADDDLFQIGTGTTPGTNPKITMDKDGNFGFGTASPGARIEVGLSGPGLAAYLVDESDGIVGQGLRIRVNERPDGTDVDNLVSIVSTGSAVGAIAFGYGNNEGFRLDDTGNVGIDTTSPSARADIKASTADGSTDGLVVRGSDDTEVFAVDSDGDVTSEGSVNSVNYRTIQIDAGAMVPCTTSGAAAGTYEYGTNDIEWDYLAFDGGATEERVQYKRVMPEDWDRSTIKVKFYWTNATGASAADTVEWGAKAGALSNDDAIDAALGTAVTVSDTVTASGDLHITSATGALTVGGSPAIGDLITFEFYRNTDGTDDMAEDAWLNYVVIQYATSNTAVPAW